MIRKPKRTVNLLLLILTPLLCVRLAICSLTIVRWSVGILKISSLFGLVFTTISMPLLFRVIVSFLLMVSLMSEVISMKTKVWPYDKPSPGIKGFGDSRCVAALYDDTRIDRILQRFRVTGVLPSSGKVALPADVVFGGEDFATLRARLDEARAAGITMDQIEDYFNRPLDEPEPAPASKEVEPTPAAEGGQA